MQFPGSYAYAALAAIDPGWQPLVAGTRKRELLSFTGPESA